MGRDSESERDGGGSGVCVQETLWKGKKARELGGDGKLYYSGVDERGRHGVGIVYSK